MLISQWPVEYVQLQCQHYGYVLCAILFVGQWSIVVAPNSPAYQLPTVA